MDPGRTVTREDLSILGGVIENDLARHASAIVEVRAVWEALSWSEAPLAVVERLDAVQFLRVAPTPADLAGIRHLRAFGEDLDLTIVVDGSKIRWWLLAAGERTLSIAGARNFWDEGGYASLWTPGEQRSRLWGRASGGALREGRVARADLRYPEIAPGRPAAIVTETYYAAGRPQFVRYVRLVEQDHE
ncbi:MAG: hypothetical protein ACR2PL_04685 [Dehalococcoidia bacterium]